jgi:antitoxin component of MazEF toxin-antitoxin module
MRAQIGRWGNGLALRIPKHLADALAIGEGTAVAIGMEGGRLVLMPCASAPTPEDLPARITPASLPTREPTTPRSVASSSDVAAPDRGGLVSLSFTPEAGREQAGRRPAIVLSPRAYHQVTP